MPFEITTKVECFLLPGDGAEARSMFLQHLADPHEMWIIAYSFTLEPMIDELVKDAPDRMLHIYLDHSQAGGRSEAPEVKRLVDAGLEVTIGTSTAGTKFICHTKGIVCNDVPQAWCWEGSVNFSSSGWSQVNTAMLFDSQTYYDAFVNQFLNLRHFAWTQERHMQLMSEPPPGALDAPPPMGSEANSVAPAGVNSVVPGPRVVPANGHRTRHTRRR